MEEKLYFKPETSGRKKKEKPEKKDRRFLKLFFFLLFLVLIVLVIIWLLKGSKTVSGQYPENTRNESLTCLSNDIHYEKVSWVDSDKKELKINAIFNGEETLKTISLIYTLAYTSESDAYYAEAKSHAQFNEGLSAVGYSVTKFDNKFARYNEKLIISLTASETEVDEYSASYFLLPLGENGLELKTIFDYQTAYEKQGFTCISTTK